MDIIYFNDPRHQDQALKGWITPRYVSMSYELPKRVVDDVLGLERDEGRGKRLSDIAASLGVDLDELTQMVQAAAEDHRTEKRD